MSGLHVPCVYPGVLLMTYREIGEKGLNLSGGQKARGMLSRVFNSVQ